MTCRTDVAGGTGYRYCPDDPPAAADRPRAVVRWAAVDEITNTGPDVDYTITTDSLGLTPRISQDGLMGLIGNPARLYPGLGGGPAVPISWTLSAPGYLPLNLSVELQPTFGFPDKFNPADAKTIFLHRRPFAIRGRVVQLGMTLNPTPLLNVPVWIAGVWWTFPAANVSPDLVIEPANLLSLHPGLYADRKLGADSLRLRPLLLTSGQDKSLVLPAVQNGVTVKLSDRVGVAPGTLLAFEPGLADRVEYVLVKAVTGASTDDQPATITLAYPLRLDHEQGTQVVTATPQAAAANNLLVRDGVPGDCVAFLDGLTGLLPPGGVVEIGGSPGAVEYQTASFYRTTSDSDGYYRLPPLSRVAMVKLHADQAPAQEPVMSPDYRRYDNLVDVVYP